MAEPDHPDVPWQPKNLPPAHELRASITAFKERLKICTEAHARRCFAELLAIFEPNTKPSGDEIRLRFAAYFNACSDMSDDIWSRAKEECIRTLKWMPKPAEFRQAAGRRFERLHWGLARCEKMLEEAEKAQAVPFKPEPRAIRLKTMRDVFGKTGDMERATKYERLLATVENREPSL